MTTRRRCAPPRRRAEAAARRCGTLGPVLLGLSVLTAGCETTPEVPVQETAGGEKFVVVSQKDLDPLEEFVIRQRKILVGDLIRVDMSSQYFEERMAMVRDLRYVARSTTTTDDGARVFILRNLNRGQTTNRNRNLLPQIKFGGGLEVVAFQELRIYVRSAVDVRRPIFLRIQAFSPDNGVRLWSSGQLRFQDRKRLTLVGELQWDERSERYRFRATVN